MPLLRTDDRDLLRVDLPADGEWVEVKRALGRDEERYVAKRAASTYHYDPETGEGTVDIGEAQDVATFATFEVAIKRWSFHVPVTPRNIRALDDASVAALKARLNELYPGPLEDAEKNG